MLDGAGSLATQPDEGKGSGKPGTIRYASAMDSATVPLQSAFPGVLSSLGRGVVASMAISYTRSPRQSDSGSKTSP
jgi:hypothetical protein